MNPVSAVEAPKPFAFCAVGDLPFEPQPEIVQGIFGHNSVGVIAGVPNAGKTFFGIDLALHVAAAAPWFGRKVKGGPVMYVGAEAPGSVKTRSRTAAAEKFPGMRLPLYIVAASPALGNESTYRDEVDRLLLTMLEIEAKEKDAIRLVVIDTLASVLGGGEENGDGMLRVSEAAKFIASRSQATVVLIHHPSKGDAASLRGHSSLSGAVDTILSITADDNTGVRTATLVKSRDSAAGTQVHFTLEVVTLPDLDCFGDPRSTCIIKATAKADAPRKRPAGKQQQALLAELERQHRTGVTGWSEAILREAGRTIGIKAQSARDAVRGLCSAGYLWGQPDNFTLKFPPEVSTK
jgi:KaiC/GvpD/RAD55 family RecA-like ATPase